MFCCALARNRLRGIALVGLVLVAAAIAYWVARHLHGWHFPPWTGMNSTLQAYLAGDAATFTFLTLGSVLLLFAASRPPARVLSSSDIYDGSARPISGNKRAALLADEDDVEAGLSATEDPTSPRAVYFTAYERIGVANPASPAAWLGRFFMTISCSAMIVIGAVRTVSLFQRQVFRKSKFRTSEDLPDCLIAFLPIVYSICTLIVVLLADPARLPPPPPEVLSPSSAAGSATGSDSRYRAARLRGGAFGSDDASYDSSLPRPGIRGSTNAMSRGSQVDNTEFFSNAALQSSYARQSTRAAY